VRHTDDYPSLPEDELMAAFERVDDFNAKLEETGLCVCVRPAAPEHRANGLCARRRCHRQGRTGQCEPRVPGRILGCRGRGRRGRGGVGHWRRAQACGNAVEIRRLQGTW